MIEFDSRNPSYKQPFGAIPQNENLSFRIQVSGSRSIQQAVLIVLKDGNPEQKRIPAEIDSGDEREKSRDLISFRFQYTAEEIGLFFYFFEVLFEDGSKESTSIHQITVYDGFYTVPDWLKTGVMYQIFPDRFARSPDYTPPTQNKKYILRDDWGGIPNHEPDKNGIIQNNDFFGGNLKGIMEKLDYLKDLGVTVIYLNPIFEAYSNHRYDTANYKKIDPMLGTESDFIDLCREAKQRGIRVILDGVFNHTGSDSVYFNKTGRFSETGAFQSMNSPYFKWYRFSHYPDQYESWWGIDTLPSVNEMEASYRGYMLWEEDSVVNHWLKCGASGFRLDVADELPDEFLEDLRYVVKKTDPDAAVIGEVWEDASNKIAYGARRKYFQGSQLDTVMNYPLKEGILDFLLFSHDAGRLEELVNSLWENYPKPAFYTLMNLLGTHDTPRILTVLTENSGNETEARQKLFLALLMVSFFPGIPCIYYGDEIGMKGERDPMNRKCLRFDEKDSIINRYYRRVLQFRRKIENLGDFDFLPREAHNGFYSFYRRGKEERLVIAINAGINDEILNFQLQDGEILQDFIISGDVTFENRETFRIRENSGVVLSVANR